MTGEIGQIVNSAIQFLQTTGSQLSEGLKIIYEAQGISQVLRQQYQVVLGAGYVAWLLNSINHKRVMPDQEAEDAALVLKCLEEYGGKEISGE